MAVQDALLFFQMVRRDDALRRDLEAIGPDAGLDALAEVAATAGFTVTAEDLQRAHLHDWRMRWARYQPAERGSSSG